MVTPFLREPTSGCQRTEIIKTIFFREFTDPSDLKNATGTRKSTCLGDHQQEWVFTNACFYPQFINSGSTSVGAQRHPTRGLVWWTVWSNAKDKKITTHKLSRRNYCFLAHFFCGGGWWWGRTFLNVVVG